MQYLCISTKYAQILHNSWNGGTNMYYAIIGDIKNSKEIDNRYEVQNKLKKNTRWYKSKV